MPKETRHKKWRQEKRHESPGIDASLSIAASIAAEKGIALRDLVDFAKFLKVDVAKEPHLLTIVAEAHDAPLPEDWFEVNDPATGNVYYSNRKTLATTWDHPLDRYYKNLLFVERRNYRERRKNGDGNGRGAGMRAGDSGGSAGVSGSSIADTPSAAAQMWRQGELDAKDRKIAALQADAKILKAGSNAKENRLLKEQLALKEKELAKMERELCELKSCKTVHPPAGTIIADSQRADVAVQVATEHEEQQRQRVIAAEMQVSKLTRELAAVVGTIDAGVAPVCLAEQKMAADAQRLKQLETDVAEITTQYNEAQRMALRERTAREEIHEECAQLRADAACACNKRPFSLLL
eukprot:SAG11_NODE_75_length_18024_cov_5.885356_23_plen_351_part_00